MLSEIERTADGSVTLYRKDIDEHYHSVKGAASESDHIYIKLGWLHRITEESRNADSAENDNSQKSAIKVFEVGFGTGLNAAITAREALDRKIPTIYYAVELYPLSAEMIEALIPYQREKDKEAFIAVNNAEWDSEARINNYFSLVKLNGNFLDMDLSDHPDVVYFDAFAPEKQPEMWNEDLFRRLYEAMNPGAVLTTYCAKGNIRRLLQKTGFTVERLPGPPGGKREVLRATKTPFLNSSLK